MHSSVAVWLTWVCCVVFIMSWKECKGFLVKHNVNDTTTMKRAAFSFKQLVASGLFVDKSLLIKEFINSRYLINVVTRPPKWGKSVNIEMVQRFFEIEVNKFGIHKNTTDRKNHILFQGGEYPVTRNYTNPVRKLKIANELEIMKRLGTVPVISLSLSSVKGDCYTDIEDRLIRELKNVYSRHKYLKVYLNKKSSNMTSSEKAILAKHYSNTKITPSELDDSLFSLSKLLYEHFKRKVIILIDDKDLPLNHAVENFGDRGTETREVLVLMEHLFKGLTNNPYLNKCLITGTLPFTEDALFLNSSQVCVSCILDEGYSHYFGFSQSEVNFITTQTLPNLKSTDKMKNWYNGWYYGMKMLFNPYDIMSYIVNKGKILDYWVESSKVKSLDEFLIYDEAQEDISKLLEDEGLVKSMDERDNPNEENGQDLFFGIFYRLMVHHGYLNAFNLTDGANEYLLRIPNQEIRNFLVDFKTEWFCNKFDVHNNDLIEFSQSLVNYRLDDLSEPLNRIFQSSYSNNVTLETEKDYHDYMSQILHRLLNHNFVFSNKHFELGRLYHLVVPRSEFQGSSSIVIEYHLLTDPSTKTKLTRQLQSLAQLTLDHIDYNLYGPLLLQYRHVNKLSMVAVAFHKSEVEVAYREFSKEGTLF